MRYAEELDLETRLTAITQRVAYIELGMRKALKHMENLAHSIALGGTNALKGGVSSDKDRPAGFLSITDQANRYLSSRLTDEQLKVIRTTKRDEETTLLRRKVICDLYDKGLSGNMIAKLLNKDHNTIFYNLTMGGKLKVKKNKQYIKRMKSKSRIKLMRSKTEKLDNF